MERKEIYTLEDIFKYIHEKSPNKRDKNRIDFNGDLIKMNSQRYHLFKHKGCKCKCGLIGSFFAKEKHESSEIWHFNLYGYDSSGNEVLMTKDHIIPKSKGGSNHISNYEPMCTICNEEKSNKLKIN